MSVPDAVALERAEAEAWADLFAARAVQIGDAVCTIVPEVPSLMINRVIGLAETGQNQPGRASSSHGNIVRFGFEPAYVRANYTSPAPVAAA